MDVVFCCNIHWPLNFTVIIPPNGILTINDALLSSNELNGFVWDPTGQVLTTCREISENIVGR